MPWLEKLWTSWLLFQWTLPVSFLQAPAPCCAHLQLHCSDFIQDCLLSLLAIAFHHRLHRQKNRTFNHHRISDYLEFQPPKRLFRIERSSGSFVLPMSALPRRFLVIRDLYLHNQLLGLVDAACSRKDRSHFEHRMRSIWCFFELLLLYCRHLPRFHHLEFACYHSSEGETFIIL